MTKIMIERYKQYSQSCGDWAGYSHSYNEAYCGWMSFHDDRDDVTKARPYLKIRVKYADSKAWFLHRDIAGNMKAIKPKVGNCILFNARCKHALLPEDIAKDCLLHNNTKYQRKIFKDLNHSTKDSKVRLVWEWEEY
jgi:hypothetical protein